MTGELRRRLRAITASDHQRLEDRLEIFARVATTPGRRRLVGDFFRLHAGAEAAMEPHLRGVEGLDFEARRRAPRLLAGLEALGARPPEPATVSGCASVGEALGWMYVLEGSTLGGRTIRRRLEETGQSMEGLEFLDPYGEHSGEVWRGFLEVLEREGREAAVADATVAGALSGFRGAEAILCNAGRPY